MDGKKKRSREVVVERLIVREPGGGRMRAMIETVGGKRGQAATVRLTLYAPDGTPALVASVDRRGEPRVVLGDADHGDALLLTRRALEIWAGGNAVITAWADSNTGKIEIMGADGTVFAPVPAPPGG